LQVKTVPGADVNGLLRQISKDYRGRNVLVVGHSNSVPEIVRRLSRDGRVPPMSENDYGTIYIVTVPTLGRPSILKLTY
jgi:2,3-bisphosphoglycerate-dependent phosphoglycerate mutase